MIPIPSELLLAIIHLLRQYVEVCRASGMEYVELEEIVRKCQECLNA